MIDSELNHLAIHSVHQKQVDERTIEIYFNIEDHQYVLSVDKNYDSYFSPWAVFHATDDLCPLCHIQKKDLKCRPLGGNHVLRLFHRLIKQPSIRLEWIFIKHKEVAENG